MARRWYALSAIGTDRPGIVADLAELIYECDCNLEDSSMTILGSEFAVLLLLSTDREDAEEHLSTNCKRLEWEKRLTVFFRRLQGEPLPFGARTKARSAALRAVGVDKAGIVAKVARCLANHNVNITHMTSHSRPEPGTGTPIYTMEVQLAVPDTTDLGKLRHDLAAVAEELQIEVSLAQDS